MKRRKRWRKVKRRKRRREVDRRKRRRKVKRRKMERNRRRIMRKVEATMNVSNYSVIQITQKSEFL